MDTYEGVHNVSRSAESIRREEVGAGDCPTPQPARPQREDVLLVHSQLFFSSTFLLALLCILSLVLYKVLEELQLRRDLLENEICITRTESYSPDDRQPNLKQLYRIIEYEYAFRKPEGYRHFFRTRQE